MRNCMEVIVIVQVGDLGSREFLQREYLQSTIAQALDKPDLFYLYFCSNHLTQFLFSVSTQIIMSL